MRPAIAASAALGGPNRERKSRARPAETMGGRVIARSHRASKDARSHPGNERSPAFPRDRVAVARPEGRPGSRRPMARDGHGAV